MKKRTKILAICAWLILFCCFGVVMYLKFTKKDMPLPTAMPTYGYIAQSVTATGTIQPLDTVAVGTQVSGVIRVLNADFNSVVKKGQLLAQLDKTLLKAVVDQDAANLRRQQSQLVFDENNFDRQKRLYATGSISRLEYERAENIYNAAVAAMADAEARLRSSTKNLSFADIYSPIDGVVLSRNVSIGQTVAAMFNTPTLFVIAKDITKMQVQAAIDEADIGNVNRGQRATFTVDAFIEETFTGAVAEVRLHPKVTANVVSFTTVINAPNKAMKLKPGMTANITVYTKEIKNALLIPAKALNFTPDSTLKGVYLILPKKRAVQTSSSASVWIKEGDTLKQRMIRIGIDDNTHVQILSGLKPRDVVVTSLPIPGQTPTEPVVSVPSKRKN